MMRNFNKLKTLAILSLAMIAYSCGSVNETSRKRTLSEAEMRNLRDSASYLMGLELAKEVQNISKEMNANDTMVVKALNEMVMDSSSKLILEESGPLIDRYQEKMANQREKEGAQEAIESNNPEETQAKLNKKRSKAFLNENMAKDGVKRTSSGLQYKVIEEGEGESPSPDDKVKVHYKGTLIDGTVFDNSYQRERPAQFSVNGVIKGWQEGLQLMKPGAKYKLFIPPRLAYGKKGAGEKIGPNQALIFTVELLSVK